MKNTFYLILLILSLGSLLFVSACKKNNDGQEGYEFTEATHNGLNETVYLVHGEKILTASGKDTIIISDTIKIKPDSDYLSINKQFICTKNCPAVYYNALPIQYNPSFIKIFIGDKVKIDTSCNFPISQNPIKTYDCTTDPKNYFNNADWKETKDGKGNVIRRQYTIDQTDLDEAK